MVGILDFGSGNVGSVFNMVKQLGVSCKIANRPEDVLSSEKLIIPGVGSFDAGMQKLNQSGLRAALGEAVLEKKKPVLGICLGMQLMCEGSEEGESEGLSWLPVVVKGFRNNPEFTETVPVMGWNYVDITAENSLVKLQRQRFYFVHSFYLETSEFEILSTTVGAFTYCASIQKNNIHGVQFHPEKSHRFGFELLKNFCFNT
jgi:glutamine amidotransferase